MRATWVRPLWLFDRDLARVELTSLAHRQVLDWQRYRSLILWFVHSYSQGNGLNHEPKSDSLL